VESSAGRVQHNDWYRPEHRKHVPVSIVYQTLMADYTRTLALFEKIDFSFGASGCVVKLGTACACPYSFENMTLPNRSSNVMLKRVLTQLADEVQSSTSAVTSPAFCRVLHLKARLGLRFCVE
jgi:hypothetical protein